MGHSRGQKRQYAWHAQCAGPRDGHERALVAHGFRQLLLQLINFSCVLDMIYIVKGFHSAAFAFFCVEHFEITPGSYALLLRLREIHAWPYYLLVCGSLTRDTRPGKQWIPLTNEGLRSDLKFR